VRIKLEDTKGTNRPERLVNNYGHALSQEWQHYRIPLPELIEKKKDDQKHWAEGDQKAIKKIVLVLKSKKEDGQFGGELWIDNVTFIKK
jgi:Txe/YoeB family toxin of Txe-Axe toxin-antitoxin module